MPITPKQQPPYYEPGIKVKTYTALLTQTGSNAPIPQILENTLGDIIWARSNAGIYTATLNNAFTENKTAIYLSSVQVAWFTAYWTNINTITVVTVGTGGATVDDRLDKSTFKIQVYV